MKKILYSYCFLLLAVFSTGLCTHQLHARESNIQAGKLKNEYNRFNLAFTSGYVFKHDSRFRDIYGQGIINAITADFCYYLRQCWGFGTKLSYWRAKGRTAFLQQRTIIQEVPLVAYLRGIKTFDGGTQVYGSFGGGFVWLKEKSYLASQHTYKGLGEVEVGINSPVWHRLNVTLALRYLFPSQCYCGNNVNVGGLDMRAGFGISF